MRRVFFFSMVSVLNEHISRRFFGVGAEEAADVGAVAGGAVDGSAVTGGWAEAGAVGGGGVEP